MAVARETNRDGFANAKILILKQITTDLQSISRLGKMVLLMQRY